MNLLGRTMYRNVIKCALTQNIRFLTCWSCGKQPTTLVSNLFCPNCKSLQEPEGANNYFKVIGISENFDVDTADLSKRYKDLQKYLHPDKYANKAKKELDISETYSSLVNEAYNTLLEPLTRGIYMLRLKGFDIPENTEVDQEFLMKIMEINEEVENADSEEDIMKLNELNKEVINDLRNQLSEAFSKNNINDVIKLLSRMKYYSSINNQIQSVIRSKGIIR